MAGRISKTAQEIGFNRSFWDEVRIMEADYTGVVTLYVTAEKRPGVFAYRLVFTSLLGSEENALHTCAYKFEFPNALDQPLSAQLWGAARKLHDLVTDAAESIKPRPMKRG